MKSNEHSRLLGRFALISCLWAAFCVTAVSLIAFHYYMAFNKMPKTIHLNKGVEQSIQLNLPLTGVIYKDDEKTVIEASSQSVGEVKEAIVYNEPVTKEISLENGITLYSDHTGSYTMDLKLYGILPFGKVSVDVVDSIMLTPAGIPVGLYVKSNGLLVISSTEFRGHEGNLINPAQNIINKGDYILSVNGSSLHSKKDLVDAIRLCKDNDAILKVNRNGTEIELKVRPKMADDGNYKIGLWIKDSTQGIGTMTFLDANGRFGALGHGISDNDTHELIHLGEGAIYETEIVAIKKGEAGAPGELTGMIDYKIKNVIGSIDENTATGIFGTADAKLVTESALWTAAPMPVALKHEVKPGPAQILCSLDGKPQYYDIEILEVNENSENIHRSIVLIVTDSDLLSKTGGIVQGMSGSPIIQNGKIAGALTHVLVSDASKGYGIYAETMIMK